MEPVKARPVVVAAVQAAPVLLDREATIGKVVALAEQAAAGGARLVAFPEAFVPGYPDWVWRTRPWDADATALYARLLDQAVVVGSPAAGVLAETARRQQFRTRPLVTGPQPRTPWYRPSGSKRTCATPGCGWSRST